MDPKPPDQERGVCGPRAARQERGVCVLRLRKEMGGVRPAGQDQEMWTQSRQTRKKAFANSGLNRKWAVSGQLAKNSKCGPGAARKEAFVY